MAVNVKGQPLYWATGVDNSGLRTGAAESKGILDGLKKSVGAAEVFAGVGVSAGLAFGQAAKKAFIFAQEFEHSMKEVSTISTMVTNDFDGISEKVVELSKQVPDTATGLSRALYQIVSAGYDSAKAMEILTVAAHGAVAGVTDTFTTADALTGIMNAYGDSAGRASDIMDRLFTIVRLGKTNMKEIAPAITNVTGIASQAGLAFDDLAAAYALGTKTLKTDIFTSALRGMLTSVIKPAQEAIEKAKELGIQFDIAAIKTKGLGGFMADLMQKTGGNVDSIAKLFPNVEGLAGVLSIAGENGEKFAEALANIKAGTGSAEVAYAKMMESFTNQRKVLANNINAELKPLGDALLGNASKLLVSLNKAFDEGTVHNIVKALGSLATVIKILGIAWATSKAAAIAFNVVMNAGTILAKTWDAILLANVYVTNALRLAKERLTASTVAMTAAQKAANVAMMANVVGAAIGVVVALGMAIAALTKRHKEYVNTSEVMKEAQREANQEIGTEISKLDILFNKLRDAKTSQEDRKKVMEEINTSYAEYLPTLLTETNYIQASAEAYSIINKKVRERIELMARERLAAKLAEQIATKQMELEDQQARLKKVGLVTDAFAPKADRNLPEAIAKSNDELSQLSDTYEKVLASITEIQIKNSTENAANTPPVPPVPPVVKDLEKELEAKKKALEVLKVLEEIQYKQRYTTKEKQVEDLYSLEVKYQGKNIELEKKYGKDTSLAQANLDKYKVDHKVELAQEAADKQKEIEDNRLKEEAEANKDMLKEVGDMVKAEIDRRDKLETAQRIGQLGLQREALKKSYDAGEIDYFEYISRLENIQIDWYEKQQKQASQYQKYLQGMNITQLVNHRQVLKQEIKDAKDQKTEMEATERLHLANIQTILLGAQVIANSIKSTLDSLGVDSPVIDDLFNNFTEMTGAASKVMSGDVLGGLADAGTSQLKKWSKAITQIVSLFDDYENGLLKLSIATSRAFNDIALGYTQQAESTGLLMALELEKMKLYQDEYDRLAAKKNTTKRQGQKDELAQSYADAKAAYDRLAESITKTTAESIADGIIQGFAAGKNPSAVFADTFESLMKNALLESFKTKILLAGIDDFYKAFTEASVSGNELTPEEIAALRAQYMTALQVAGENFAQLEKISGLSLAAAGTATAESQGGLAGAIKGITEDTASLMAGQLGNMRINIQHQLEVNKDSLVVLRQIAVNTSYLKLLVEINQRLGTNETANQLRANGNV